MWIRSRVNIQKFLRKFRRLPPTGAKADWKTIGETVWNFFANGNVLGSTFNVASTIIGSVANFTIGLVFAIYLLLQKEKLGGQFKRVLYSIAPENKADRFLEICQLSSDTFSSFISGQCLEACILGLMFFFPCRCCVCRTQW